MLQRLEACNKVKRFDKVDGVVQVVPSVCQVVSAIVGLCELDHCFVDVQSKHRRCYGGQICRAVTSAARCVQYSSIFGISGRIQITSEMPSVSTSRGGNVVRTDFRLDRILITHDCSWRASAQPICCLITYCRHGNSVMLARHRNSIKMKLLCFLGMSPKAQHARNYRKLPSFLRNLRKTANLSQRQLGKRLGKPQSWIHNCETGNRRVDVTEFILWCKGCGADPADGFNRLLDELYLFA